MKLKGSSAASEVYGERAREVKPGSRENHKRINLFHPSGRSREAASANPEARRFQAGAIWREAASAVRISREE
jgi:hypothetical protein